MTNLSELQHYYILECYYYWGGEIKVPLMIQTPTNMVHLIQTDLPSYINFVQTNLAHLFDFANYSNDPTLWCIADIELNQESPNISTALEQLSEGELAIIRKNNALKIEVNRNHPSSFDSFTEIDEEMFNKMKYFIQHHTVNA